MSLSTYCNPRLYIKGEEIQFLESAKIKFTSNQINSLNLTLGSIDIIEDKLNNEEIEFYLNYGADDSVPYFRGIVKSVKSSSKNTTIVAQDPRVLLTAKGALPLSLSNKRNYDGWSLGQFLKHYIKENLWEEVISHSPNDIKRVVTREQPATLTYSDTAANALATMGFTQGDGGGVNGGMKDGTQFTISDGFTSCTYTSQRAPPSPTSGHGLDNVILVDGGSGYTSPPTVTVTDTTGSGGPRVVPDVVSTIDGDGVVDSITVNTPGAQWEPAATASVVIDPPDGPGTQATAIVFNGNIDTSTMAGGTPNSALAAAQVAKKIMEHQNIAVSNVTLAGSSGVDEYTVITFQSLVAGTQGNIVITQSKGVSPDNFFDRTASNSGFASGTNGASSSISPSFTVDYPPIRKDTLKIEVKGYTFCGLTAGGSTGITSNYYIKGKESGKGLYYPVAYETNLISSSNTAGETVRNATAIDGSNNVGSTNDNPYLRINSGTAHYVSGTVDMTFNKPLMNEVGSTPFYVSYEQAGVTKVPRFLDVLNDTVPLVSLKDVRGDNIQPYKLIQDNIDKALDTTVYDEPKKWIIDIVEGSEITYLTFVKRKPLTDSPSYDFSYRDGLIDLKHQKRVPANTAVVTGQKGAKAVFSYGNRPSGLVSISKSIDSDNNADCYKEAVKLILKDFDENSEVKAITSKAPYIALESLVRLSVGDNNIDGNTRVTGKQVSWSKSKGVTIILDLNRTPVKVSNLITRAEN